MAFVQWLAISSVVFGLVTTLSFGSVNLYRQGRSFSSVIKGFPYKKLGEEVVLYEKKFYYVGYITEQWFTSKLSGPFDQHARIRIYIDDEDTASIDYMLTMGQAVNAATEQTVNNTPWSSRLFGRLADGGGYFNTFRIPFKQGIKITVTNEVSTGPLSYIVRGLVGIQLSVGSFKVPSYSRLRVYKQDKTIAPLEFVQLSQTTNKAGMLFLVTFDIQSETPLFLEGCVRAKIDNSNETTFLSSGTEDFFLSAFYFNRGEYHGYHSGLTYQAKNGSSTHILAYKFFVDDPVLFSNSFKLIWRNFEQSKGPDGCPDQFPPNPSGKEFDLTQFGDPAKARIQSYVWVYEWDNY